MVFFLIAFHILLMERALMAREYGLHPLSMLTATLAALLVAKVVLIADMLPIINRFPEKPLIYSVAWKTVIYVGASLLVHYLEHLIPLWWHMGFQAANEHLWSKLVWPHFWAIQLLLVVLFLIYAAMRELVRVIGRARVRQIFFGTPVPRGA